MEDEEVFYLIAYSKTKKKFRSADEMLGVLVQTIGGDGPVRVVHEDDSVEWRDLNDAEKDIDYDNTILLGSFIRDVNSQKR
jgi:hypothetical protein